MNSNQGSRGNNRTDRIFDVEVGLVKEGFRAPAADAWRHDENDLLPFQKNYHE